MIRSGPRGASHWAAVLVLVGAAAFLAGITFNDQLDVVLDDNAVYLSLARSLADGDGYRVTVASEPHRLYPPLLPIVFMPAILVGLDALVAGKALSIIATLLFVGITADAVMRRWGVSLPAISVATALTLHPLILEGSAEPKGEMFYLLMSCVAVLLWDRASTSQRPGALLAGSLAFGVGAFYFRTVGLALLVALSISTWLRFDKRTAAFLSLCWGLAVLPWMAYANGEGGSYLSYLATRPSTPNYGLAVSDLVLRLGLQAARYVGRILPETVFYPWLGGTVGIVPWKILLGLLLAIILMMGWLKTWNRERSLLHVYVAVYAAVLLAWPWYSTRFLVPVVPLIIGFMIAGLVPFRPEASGASGSTGGRSSWSRSAAFALILFVLGSSFYTVVDRRHNYNTPESQAFLAAVERLGRQLDASFASGAGGSSDILVACRKPGLVSWILGVPATRYLVTLNDAEQIDYLRRVEATHLIVDELSDVGDREKGRRQLRALVATRPDLFSPVIQLAGTETVVYAVRPAQW